MTNDIELKVKKFICSFWNYDFNKLKMESTLNDLGMFGADKQDFLLEFAEKFNVNLNSFPFNKYVEEVVINPSVTIKRIFFGNKKKPRC